MTHSKSRSPHSIDTITHSKSLSPHSIDIMTHSVSVSPQYRYHDPLKGKRQNTKHSMNMHSIYNYNEELIFIHITYT
jgi:hypothetical protein